KHSIHGFRQPLPLLVLFGESPATLRRQRVVARAPVVLRNRPATADQTLPLQPVQRRIQRALVDLELVAGCRANPVHDTPAVRIAELERLEHEQVECASDEIALQWHWV